MNRTAKRIGYIFLCTLPFLDLAVVGVRALRIPGIYQAIGGVLFAAVVIAAWIVGARVIGCGAAGERRLALAGALLIVPFAIISLLWVGLGAPFQATTPEIAGIPAIPWIMPCLFGVVLLRRAGDEYRVTESAYSSEPL